MPKYILDTDAVTRQQRGDVRFLRRLAELTPSDVFTTVITLREQVRGRLAVIDQVDEQFALIDAYTNLQTTLSYFQQINILPFTPLAFSQLQQFRTQKIRISTQDLRIAAIVASVNGILVTSNRRDFNKVPDLRIEDWMINSTL